MTRAPDRAAPEEGQFDPPPVGGPASAAFVTWFVLSALSIWLECRHAAGGDCLPAAPLVTLPAAAGWGWVVWRWFRNRPVRGLMIGVVALTVVTLGFEAWVGATQFD
ncbi:MAG: hypothetical protein RIE08_06060 [Acidimicrobiales bacterium]